MNTRLLRTLIIRDGYLGGAVVPLTHVDAMSKEAAQNEKGRRIEMKWVRTNGRSA